MREYLKKALTENSTKLPVVSENIAQNIPKTLATKIQPAIKKEEFIPRGSFGDVKENDLIATKFREGNAYNIKTGKLIPVNANHVAIGKIGADGKPIFFTNITTNKQTFLRGVPAIKNIPFSNTDINGNSTYGKSNETIRITADNNNKITDNDVLANIGFKPQITQFLHPWSYVLEPTSNAVHQKVTKKQSEVFNQILKRAETLIRKEFPDDVLANKPRATYSTKSPDFNQNPEIPEKFENNIKDI